MKTYADMVCEQLPGPDGPGMPAAEVALRLGQGLRPTLDALEALRREGRVVRRGGVPGERDDARWTLAPTEAGR